MATPASTKVGHGIAKVLMLKLDERRPKGDDVTRGESTFSVSTAEPYVEKEPTAAEWLREIFPTGKGMLHWFLHLFPFAHWITRYNAQWLYGDLVAGKLHPVLASIRSATC